MLLFFRLRFNDFEVQYLNIFLFSLVICDEPISFIVKLLNFLRLVVKNQIVSLQLTLSEVKLRPKKVEVVGQHEALEFLGLKLIVQVVSFCSQVHSIVI